MRDSATTTTHLESFDLVHGDVFDRIFDSIALKVDAYSLTDTNGTNYLLPVSFDTVRSRFINIKHQKHVCSQSI